MVVAVDKGGNEFGRMRFHTDVEYPKFKKQLKRQLDELIAVVGQPLEAIALALPGLVDYKKHTVTGFGNLPWKNINILNFLKKTYSVPVVVDNDANFGAVGEARRGAGKGYKTVLYITVSTGIGTGVAIGGRIDPALAHSEGGMMHFWEDGRYQKWEKLASGKAFLKKYGRMGREVAKDEAKIWKAYAKELSLGIAELIAIIQPDVIVVGGSMGEHLPKYKEYLEKELAKSKTSTTSIPPLKQAADFNGAVINGGIEALTDVL